MAHVRGVTRYLPRLDVKFNHFEFNSATIGPNSSLTAQTVASRFFTSAKIQYYFAAAIYDDK